MNFVFDCKNKSIEMSDAGQGSIKRLGIKSELQPEETKTMFSDYPEIMSIQK